MKRKRIAKIPASIEAKAKAEKADNRAADRAGNQIGFRAWLPVLLFVLLTVTGCTPKPNDSSDLRAFDNAEWIYGRSVEFLPEMTDSAAQMDVVLLLRHGNGFEYSDLWLEVRRPVGDTVAVDTFDIALADKAGNWYGKGLGLSFQKQDTLYRNVTVARNKPWRVRHIMRCDTLSNIEQIGMGFDQTGR